MALKRGLSDINLLPSDRFENSTLGRFLSWAMTSGRVLVVLTEFVVLLAFASRFYFDKKLNDISEVIDQKQTQIEAYVDTENQIRVILHKQNQISKYLKDNLEIKDKLDMLRKMLPQGVTLEKLTLDGIGINMSGEAGSELGFAQFLRNLKRSEKIAYINIKDTVYEQLSGSVKFTIQLNFK